MCHRHYQQWLARVPLAQRSRARPERGACIGPECEKIERAHGLCTGHYQQWHKGQSLAPLRPMARTDIRDELGRKRCNRCGEWKSETEFYRSSGAYRDGMNPNCNLCDRLYSYHITARDFHELLERQGGVCAICGRKPPEFHVDHDHSCCPERKRSCGNCVRGLLCPDCNGALGLMNDDPARMENAARYLREVMHVRASS